MTSASLGPAYRTDGAARAFTAASALDDGFLAARANLIHVDLARNDLAAARTAADAFVAAAPDSARALYARGIVALQAGDAASARDDFGKLLANDPEYAVAHYNLALAERRLGRDDDAERELRSALALAPGYVRASLALGAVLLRRGERGAARTTFDEAAGGRSIPACARSPFRYATRSQPGTKVATLRVLVIEDDDDIARALATMLARARYAVDVVADGEAGLERLLSGGYGMAIVDVALPLRDGFSVCRAARAELIATPLLILTARDAVEDRIRGLDAGADDYLIKPFAGEELTARVRALLRRSERPPQSHPYEVGSLSVDPGSRTAVVGRATLDLGATELRLLEFFARHRGMTLTRAKILEHIWDYNFQGSSNIVDVYVSQLRRKLRSLKPTAEIATVWGVGYKLVEMTPKKERSSA